MKTDTQNDCAVGCPGREMKFPACNHYFLDKLWG